MPSYDNKVLTGDQLVYFSGLVKTALASKADSSALAGKQDALTFDGTYNASSNPVATMSSFTTFKNSITVDDGLTYSPGDNEIGLNIDVDDPAEVGFLSFGGDGEGQMLLTIDWDQPLGGDLTVEYDSESGDPVKLDTVLSDLWTGYEDLRGKQDALVFNTDYDATENPVATMTDISDALDNRLFVDQIVAEEVVDENTGEVIGQTYLDEVLSDKQDALVFNTAYNASSNKVATMADITTALGGISSFSFEIVQSLPQSNISTSKIYLVAKQTSGTNQVYTEYAYVNNGWEIIGDTSMTIDTLTNQEVATIWSTATATT